jgi:hypothetical protein
MRNLNRFEWLLSLVLLLLVLFFYPLVNLVAQVLVSSPTFNGHSGIAITTDQEPKNEPVRSGSDEPLNTHLQVPILNADSSEEKVVRTFEEFFHYFDSPSEPQEDRLRMEVSEDQIPLVVAELRRRYPAVPLKDRLENINFSNRIERLRKLYPVSEHLQSQPKDESAPRSELAQESSPSKMPAWKRDDPRLAALHWLHSSKAQEFINQQNFGFSRMLHIAPNHLKYPEFGEIVLGRHSGTTALYGDEPLVALPIKDESSGNSTPAHSNAPHAGSAGEATIEPEHDLVSARLPFRDDVEKLNQKSAYRFLTSARIGIHAGIFPFNDLETSLEPKSAIGFLGHGIDFVFEPALGISTLADDPYPLPRDINSWDLNRLELVSLLMHDEFRVYVSENFPKMEELKSAETRPLDSFEFLSLGKLFQSEDVVIESTQNRIRMLGALRAQDSCLECHSVRTGELLGALSYELIRQIPVSED